MPVISIITPCYNARKYVTRTLESVCSQTFGDWEHITLDDGSSDDSATIVERFIAEHKDPRFRLFRQGNGGCATARNRGFEVASPRSTYLLFLDSDDLLEPNALQVMVDYLDRHREVGLAYCSFQIIDQDDQILSPEIKAGSWARRYVPTLFGVRKLPADRPETPLESIFAITAIIPSVCFLRRSIFEQTPGWDEEIGIIYEDVGVYIHMALRSEVHYVPQELVRYRKHPAQSSTAAEKFAINLARLYKSWRAMPGLTAEQSGRVRRALWFRDYRLVPYLGFKAGIYHLRRGNPKLAARFIGGAIRRYAISFF